MCWYLERARDQARTGEDKGDIGNHMGTLMLTLFESRAKPRFASEQHRPASLGVGWQGGMARGLVASIPFPSGMPITKVHPMKRTPRKSGAKNSKGGCRRGGVATFVTEAWGLTHGLPKAGRRAL